MCLSCGIPVDKDSAFHERYCCEDCCYSNGVMGVHSDTCCCHRYHRDGMSIRDEIIFRAHMCFREAAYYSGTLGIMVEETDPDVCNKIHCTERPLSSNQIELQKSCSISKLPTEPDLSTVTPNLGTRARFVFNRSTCHLFNQDWTHGLYHIPIAIHHLGRTQPWLTKMNQSDVMPAALAHPGLAGPQYIVSAGAYIGGCLETRDRPFDACISLAVDIGTVKKPYWAYQRFEHVLMSYIKTSRRKPVTVEQSRRMYPGDPGSNIVPDKHSHYIRQPERENSDDYFDLNLWTMKQVSSGKRGQVNRRQLKWVVRSEFCPSGQGRERQFVYPQSRMNMGIPPNYEVHQLELGSELKIPHGEYLGKSRRPVNWSMFGSGISVDATFATFYQYIYDTFFTFYQRIDIDCKEISEFRAKPTSPRGVFGGAAASSVPSSSTTPSATSTGVARGQKRALSFPEVHSERTINFSFSLATSVQQFHAELHRIADAVGDLNKGGNAADREYLRIFGDLYTNKKGKHKFVRHSAFQIMNPRELWNRLTTDVNFMDATYVEDSQGHHYLRAHIQKKHKKSLKQSASWSMEKQFDIQMRQASRHIAQKLPHAHHVYRSITEYFDELRMTTNIPSSAVWWTCNSLGYNNAFDYAFVLKGPGIGSTIINTKPPPTWLAEAMATRPETVSIRHHGTAPHNANGIARDGFRLTPGAGSDELLKVWGFDVHGVYVAKHSSMAWTYPQEGQDARKRHQCGYLIADDGSLPQKLLVTVAVLDEDCLFEVREQQVYPCDRIHILSMTWLSNEPDRLCADQQQWVSVYTEVDREDVQPLLFMATEETGQIMYSNLDGEHDVTGRFGPEIEATLREPGDLSYTPAYNDAGSESDVNQFQVVSRVRRELICNMTDEEIHKFPPFLRDQHLRIKRE